MTSMEEETQMQEDMLVEEVPETTPLEQHASKGEAKEINPKTSKWLWFLVVILLVLASFGVAFYIMQQNAELESEIESNFFPESERQTNKAIKEIGTTLKEVKETVEKNGEENSAYNATAFSFTYPQGWHLVEQQNVLTETKDIATFLDTRLNIYLSPKPIYLPEICEFTCGHDVTLALLVTEDITELLAEQAELFGQEADISENAQGRKSYKFIGETDGGDLSEDQVKQNLFIIELPQGEAVNYVIAYTESSLFADGELSYEELLEALESIVDSIQ